MFKRGLDRVFLMINFIFSKPFCPLLLALKKTIGEVAFAVVHWLLDFHLVYLLNYAVDFGKRQFNFNPEFLSQGHFWIAIGNLPTQKSLFERSWRQ